MRVQVVSSKEVTIMGLYQVEITTDMDIVSVLVNADDDNEAISIALTMFEQAEVESEGSMTINAVAYPAC